MVPHPDARHHRIVHNSSVKTAATQLQELLRLARSQTRHAIPPIARVRGASDQWCWLYPENFGTARRVAAVWVPTGRHMPPSQCPPTITGSSTGRRANGAETPELFLPSLVYQAWSPTGRHVHSHRTGGDGVTGRRSPGDSGLGGVRGRGYARTGPQDVDTIATREPRNFCFSSLAWTGRRVTWPPNSCMAPGMYPSPCIPPHGGQPRRHNRPTPPKPLLARSEGLLCCSHFGHIPCDSGRNGKHRGNA